MGHRCKSPPKLSFMLLCALLIVGFAGLPQVAVGEVQVQDSPLYGALLKGAMADLREPAVATARWSAEHVGRAADFVFGSPAWALTNTTLVGEPTYCQNNAKNVTQCDKGSADKQRCTKTVHSQEKTQCSGPSDKSVCKDNGTSCPGSGGSNNCSTNSPGNFTHCTETDKATLCLGQATRCQPGDRNECLTTQGASKTNCRDGKTYCKAGQDGATLCRGEATGCSSKGANICKTSNTSDRTSCVGTNITMCKDAGTICTGPMGDQIASGCEFRDVALSLTRGLAGGPGVLVVVDAPPGYFVDPGMAHLMFDPPGPIVTEEATLVDDAQARFYVNVPVVPPGQYMNYQVSVTNGFSPLETPGMVMGAAVLPGTNVVGLVTLVVILCMVGAYVAVRRREGKSAA